MKSLKVLKWLLKRWLKILSPVVASIFLSTTLMGCMPAGCTKKPLPDPKLLQKKLRKASNAEKLSKKLENLSVLLKTIENGLLNNKDIGTELKELKDTQVDISKLNKAIEKDFAKTRKILENVDSKKKDKIQAKVEKDYSKKFNELSKQLSAIISEKDQEKLKTEISSLQSWLDKVAPEPIHQPLGTDLPHRVVDYKAGPPRLGTGIAPAYLPNLPNVEPSKLSKEPTEQDVSETIEVQFTDDITTLTAQLEHNPVKMYEWVKNNIVYEPYCGSRKGANETLWEKGGNDFDQASLLIALYRYSGIPARYVYGVAEIPIDKAMNWVGVEKPEVAVKVFSAGGIPSQAVVEGGVITKLRLEHVWVEVYVNYENYRGLDLGGEGQKEWIPLDPSFKQYQPQAKTELPPELLDFDEEAYLEEPPSKNPSIEFLERIKAYFPPETSQTALEELTKPRQIKAENLGLLPATLQVKTLLVKSEYSKLPDSFREKVALSVADDSGITYLSTTLQIPEIAGKSITLSFKPATQEDETIEKEYLSSYLAPSYLLQLKPVLKIDGQVKTTGDTLACGKTYLFSRSYQSKLGEVNIESFVTGGSDYALVFNLGHIPLKLLEKKAKEVEMPSELEAVREVLKTKNPANELIYIPLAYYYLALDELNQRTSKTLNVVDTRITSEGLVALEAKVTSIFDTPIAISPDSFYIDIKRDASIPFSSNGDNSREKEYVTLSGYTGSHLEHAAIEDIFGTESISAVKLMQVANENGIALKTVTSANASEVDALQTAKEVKAEIKNAINQGLEVIVPEKDFTYKLWNGIAYIIRDPETGEAGYMISSSLAGGKTVEIVFGGGIAGAIALNFLKKWFTWFEGAATSSAYLYFWAFWCALQHKLMIPPQLFLEVWMQALQEYEGWTFDMESNRDAKTIDCTDLLLWSFSDAFIDWSIGIKAGFDIPLWIPDTTADGLVKNRIEDLSDRVLTWLFGAPALGISAYFPYTRSAEDESWSVGDIISVDLSKVSASTPEGDGIIDHTMIYAGENENGDPLFISSSAHIGEVVLLPNPIKDPDNDTYEQQLDYYKVCEHRVWTYPYDR